MESVADLQRALEERY